MTKKIVWIEDDLGIIGEVVRPLRNAGHQIFTFTDVPSALNEMDTLRSADVLLVDLIHPTGVDNHNFGSYPGLDFLEQIRKVHHMTTPVIVLTVVTSKDAKDRLAKLKGVEVINKPVRPSILKEKVEHAMGIN
jgi:DNA-binding response OmpR family regulator